jgi:nicotinamidase-related amidase
MEANLLKALVQFEPLISSHNPSAIHQTKSRSSVMSNPINRRFVISAAALGVAAVASQTLAQPTPSGRPSALPSASRSPQGAVWNHSEVALLLIDYQKEMFENLRSETPPALVDLNTRFLIRIAKALNIPVVLSTVGVEMGVNSPTVPSITRELPGAKVIDRSSMNAWEDNAFRAAVQATGRRRLVFGALYTEICLAYPVVDALKEGYEVAFVSDAVGGLSQLAHTTAIDRMAHAGAVPNTTMAIVAEFFRDWKTAEAQRARPIILWYMDEFKKVSRA